MCARSLEKILGKKEAYQKKSIIDKLRHNYAIEIK